MRAIRRANLDAHKVGRATIDTASWKARGAAGGVIAPDILALQAVIVDETRPPEARATEHPRSSSGSPLYQGHQQSIGMWITFGPRFLSALGAGALVGVIGLKASMTLAAIATAGGFVVLVFSPVRRLRATPTPTGV